MIKFDNMKELIALAEQGRCTIGEIVYAYEAETSQKKTEKVIDEMWNSWLIMRESAMKGVESNEKSVSGLVGGDAHRLMERASNGSYAGRTMLKTAAYALAVSEVNASMGRIVACPTAGSCGILPAVMLNAVEEKQPAKKQIINALFTAAGVGMVIAENASIAGAEGGCQAECGSAAAMAAAALAQIEGGTPQQVGQAVALALKNLLGLVCDPVAGLVEVPCVKRNGFAAVHALTAAEMALAGIESVIPVDEVIDTMYKIGNLLPKSLRETSEAGLADTPTGRNLERQIFHVR